MGDADRRRGIAKAATEWRGLPFQGYVLIVEGLGMEVRVSPSWERAGAMPLALSSGLKRWPTPWSVLKT